MTTRKVELLQTQIEKIPDLIGFSPKSPEFVKWRRDTWVIIEKIFGALSRNFHDFKNIEYSLTLYTVGTPLDEFESEYVSGLKMAEAFLQSMISEITEFDLREEPKQTTISPKDGPMKTKPNSESGTKESIGLEAIEQICSRFHLVARQLCLRYAGRDQFKIEDEYDVQDLFHSLLHLHFQDIRAEECTPSYAGKSSRVDFLLKDYGLVVEIKKTRKGLEAKEVGDQLSIDIMRYKSHPFCKTLVCFVYDPEERIVNPRGFESDLNSDAPMKVRVIITPRA